MTNSNTLIGLQLLDCSRDGHFIGLSQLEIMLNMCKFCMQQIVLAKNNGHEIKVWHIRAIPIQLSLACLNTI